MGLGLLWEGVKLVMQDADRSETPPRGGFEIWRFVVLVN